MSENVKDTSVTPEYSPLEGRKESTEQNTHTLRVFDRRVYVEMKYSVLLDRHWFFVNPKNGDYIYLGIIHEDDIHAFLRGCADCGLDEVTTTISAEELKIIRDSVTVAPKTGIPAQVTVREALKGLDW